MDKQSLQGVFSFHRKKELEKVLKQYRIQEVEREILFYGLKYCICRVQTQIRNNRS